MADRVVLITGTSSGIGLASAVRCAVEGFTTIATMRDLKRANALTSTALQAGVVLDIRELDVANEASVDACIGEVVARYGRIDAIVNNAGAGHLGTVERESIDDIRGVMEVNFFGVVRVTRAALPYLRASAGRVVTVSSVGGVVGQPFNEAYCASKFAVEGFMESLAPVAAALGVRVSVIEPGAVASEFVANVGIDPVALTAAAGPYADLMRAYLARTAGAFAGAQTPDDAAAAILRALTDDQPRPRYQTSPGATGFVQVKLADLDGSAVQALTTPWLTIDPARS